MDIIEQKRKTFLPAVEFILFYLAVVASLLSPRTTRSPDEPAPLQLQ